MSIVSTVGIDLAKNVFSVHAVDSLGQVVVRRSFSRAKLSELVAQLPPCLIGMEACSGAHEWARRLVMFGHVVKLMAPKFVAPYRKSGKNDGNTATLNRLRGLLAEFGHVLPLRPSELHRRVPQLLEKLPARVATCVQDLLEHARGLQEKVLQYEREIKLHVHSNALACRAQTRLGIGPITASALLATVGNGRDFKNGRQFAAWLGLVPRQYSTGGKTRLGHITKRGDPYLRTLLVMGAPELCCNEP